MESRQDSKVGGEVCVCGGWEGGCVCVGWGVADVEDETGVHQVKEWGDVK